MPRNPATSAPRAALAARIAWLATFVVPLILAALLLGVSSAHGAELVAPDADPVAFEEELDVEAGEELEEGECEEAEEELEEGELSEAEAEEICAEANSADGKAGGRDSVAPEECLLRSTHARAVANPERNELKLTVGYTTYEPVSTTVEVRAGSTQIGSTHRHLGRSGVLRIVESLGKNQVPERIVVGIDIPASPRYCGKFLTQRIPVSRTGGDPALRHKHRPRVR